MALGLTNRGSGTHNTGATTFTLSPASNLAAGSLAVLCVSGDNSSSGGSTNDLGAVTDSLGNTWTRQRNPIFDNGAASAGVQNAIYTTPQNAGALQTGTVITVATPSSPVAKTWTLTEVTKAANAEVAVIGGADQAGATSSAPSFASSSIAVGDAVIFMVGMEAGTTQTATADADSTNGSWSTQQYAEIGSTTSGSAMASQGKVQTTTPSAQTYNPTLGLSVDLLVSYIILHEQHTASASIASVGGGVTALASRKAAASAVVGTGGGVIAATISAAHVKSVTATGGGVRSATIAGAHNEVATATGGGVATATSVAGRRSALAATGSGAAVITEATGRAASPTASAGGSLHVDHSVTSAENHDASFTATGGGSMSLAIRTSRAVAATAVGGGVTAPAATTGRSAPIIAAGAGAAVLGHATGRSAAIAGAGSGAVSASVASARLAAALMSGGGVLLASAVGARSGSPAASGGGVATVDGTSVEVHSGSVVITGAGVGVLEASAARMAALAATGRGGLAWAAWGAHAGAAAATGGGRATVAGERPVVESTVGFAADFGPVTSAGLGRATRGGSSVAAQAGFDRPDWNDD